MSKTSTHRAIGAATAVAAFAIMNTGNFSFVEIAQVCTGIYAGCNAPDWLEMPKRVNGIRYSVIPHRTITHWLGGWIALLVWLLLNVRNYPVLLPLGFTIGAISHIITDARTPMGVPLLNPFRRGRL